MPPVDPHHETRIRLMEAAGQVFAETGFRDATVREICQKADANIAAVNYHFGSKEALYREVLSYTFLQTAERFPLNPAPDAPAEEQLRQFVAVSLERMLDEGKPAWHGKLVVREMANPTGVMDVVADNYMKPHFGALLGILRQLLGEGVPEPRVVLLALSVMGQVTFYMMGREACVRVAPGVSLGPAERKVIAAHIAQVTIAAARDIRASS